MSSNMDWVFDPLPASGRREGGTAATYVFTPTLDVFVREVLQNAHDQRTGDGSISVSFTLRRLTGRHKDAFLEGIGWSTLEPHLRGTAEGTTRSAPMVQEALGDLGSDPLTLLSISDYGGRGLTGDEQGGGNFSALCRDTLMTTEDRVSRGGSHGLGKAVLWRFSQFSTVVFSSVLDVEGAPYRLFGRTELPYHEADGDAWAGPGWWGRRVATGRGDRAESVWNDAARSVASGTPLHREREEGTGTTIVVVGFQEPAQEDVRPLSEVAEDLLDSAARSFWPSITRQPRTLRVTASVHENDDEVFRDEADVTPEILPFRHAVLEEHPSSRAVEPLQVAERTIEIELPALKSPAPDDPTGTVRAAARLRLLRVGDQSNGADYRNKIALVRGAGMVVDYWRPARIPLEGGAFHAVLLAGQAHGNSTEDLFAERFLRAAEPPAHDRWVHHTDAVKNGYRPGAKARLDELWGALSTAVVEMTQLEPPSDAEGPKMLAKLFPIGDVGTPVRRGKMFHVDFTHQSLASGRWFIGGRVERRTDDLASWRVHVSVWLDGDSTSRSKDDLLPVASLQLGEVADGVEAWISDGGSGVIELPPHVPLVEYTIETDTRDMELLRRTRVRADVRPSLRGAD